MSDRRPPKRTYIPTDEVETAPIDEERIQQINFPGSALTKRNARELAKVFRTIRRRAPQADIDIAWDDLPSPGEWDFPAMFRFLRWFARYAGIDTLEAAIAVPWLGPEFLVILGRSGALGKEHEFALTPSPSPGIH